MFDRSAEVICKSRVRLDSGGGAKPNVFTDRLLPKGECTHNRLILPRTYSKFEVGLASGFGSICARRDMYPLRWLG